VSADDAELVRRLRAGDAGAFAEVVRRHHASMLRVAATFVAGRADAEDVAQETWLAVVRGIDGFEGRSSLRTWIFTILVNRAKSHGGRQARRPEVPAELSATWDDPLAGRFEGRTGRGAWRDPVPPWQDDPQLRLDSTETLARIAAEIEELPPLRRRVLVLRDVEGWTAAEVADLLGISDGNQRVLLHRARTVLRQRLEKERGR
jgi:RNA polymerase sigma-70 factor (ECF subfamily)